MNYAIHKFLGQDFGTGLNILADKGHLQSPHIGYFKMGWSFLNIHVSQTLALYSAKLFCPGVGLKDIAHDLTISVNLFIAY